MSAYNAVAHCNDIHHVSATAIELMEQELITAIKGMGASLELYYQPIVSVKDGVVAAESLLRWHHPQWGLIKIEQLIHVMSSAEVLHLLSEWVIHRACSDFISWQHEPGLRRLKYISVNVCTRQFRDDRFVDHLKKVIIDTGIEPSKVCLEIKETILLMDHNIVERRLRELKDFGVQITLDNYGTGQSSIAEISTLPIERLKIDRNFIHNIDAHDTAMVTEAMLDMARHLTIESTAVGIERSEQLSFLSIRGCSTYQGNYFCPPLAKDDFVLWCRVKGRDLKETLPDSTLLEDLSKRAGMILDMSPESVGRHNVLDLLYKLHIHESELEFQNKELMDARHAMERSAELFTQLYHQSPVGYVVINESGTVVHINQTILDSLGHSRKEMLNSLFTDFVAPWQREGLREEIKKAFLGDEMQEIEMHLLRSDHDMYIAKIEGRLTSGIHLERGRDEQLLLLSVDEITNLKKTERELMIARDQAMAAARAKSAFLATMSHEIRTPMNAVLGMAELLEGTPLDDIQHDYVSTIRQAGNVLLAIINDILDLSKIEADRLELDPTPFDMELTLHEVVTLLALQAEQKGIELILDYPTHHEHQVIGDAGRIKQVLYNLINNAIKFTKTGYVHIKLRIRKPLRNSVRILVEVIDTGIGIGKSDQNKLFRSFSQVDGSTTRKYGGTGLGLAICKRLIDIMSGRIGVRSRDGDGSTFWFTIPLPIGHKPEQLNSTPLFEKRVLIVDDSPLNLRILKKQLTHFGINVFQAENGTDALEILRRHGTADKPIEAGIIDYMMPGMNGEQLAHEIFTDSNIPDLPLILLSSVGTKGDAEHFAKQGFSGYLTKPSDSKTIQKMLSALLSDSKKAKSPTMLTKYSIDESEVIASEEHASFCGKILLVDDVQANQKVAATMLQRLGLNVDVAHNGMEAIELWRRSMSGVGYSLIFMDLVMPEMDGFQAARAIREIGNDHPRRIPIVALTASIGMTLSEKANHCDIDDWLTKPFTRTQLVDMLTRWLVEEGENATMRPVHTQQDLAVKEKIFEPEALNILRDGLGDDVHAMLPMLLDSLSTLLSQLAEANTQGNTDEIRRFAHSIKSSSATLGGEHLAKLALELEMRAKNGNVSDATVFIDEMHGGYIKLRTHVEKALAVND